MTEREGSRARWPLWPLAALAVAALALLALLSLRPAAVPPPAKVPPRAEAPAHARVIPLPLDRVERITPLGGESACVTGGRHLACTRDGGETWTPYADLPDHVLAVARVGGEVLAASTDGAIYAATPELVELRAIAPRGLTVVDAADRHGTLWLLGHRYSKPADALHLPVVTSTEVLELGEGGELTERGSIPGYGGDRLLLQGDTIATYAVYDALAFRSTDGGRTFRRVPAREPLAADYDGLLASVARRSEKLPQGGGAQPSSTLFLSADNGATWDAAFQSPGEIVVEFADAKHGVVIAKNEGAAYLTSDGGKSFQPAAQDDSLASAVDVAWLGDRWVAVSADGKAVRF